MVQTGGSRTKNRFKKAIKNDLLKFKSFVIEPFSNELDLYHWFERIVSFPHFGIGIATIYLNRINPDLYPVMNNKTLIALNKIGNTLSFTKTFRNYVQVKEIQKNLIAEFPVLENLYKADALNHL